MNVQPEILVILGGAAVVLVAWLLLRFGKIIARALLVAAVLTIAVVGVLALLTQASANRQTATAALKAAETTTLGLSLSLLIIGALVIALLAALGGVGYLWLRLQLAERRPQARTPRDAWQPGPNALWGRKRTPLPPAAQPPPVVYFVETPQPTEAVQEGWGFEGWGW